VTRICEKRTRFSKRRKRQFSHDARTLIKQWNKYCCFL